MEPLEGEEEEESVKDDASYNKYINEVNKELNVKEIAFVNDLGLNNNLLNTKALFDKIKKQGKFKILKTQNSLRSLSKSLIKNKIGNLSGSIIDIEENENVNLEKIKEKEKKRRKKEKEKKRKKDKEENNHLNISSIYSLLLSKLEIKKYLKNNKRIMTYNNINNLNKYISQKDLILNIKEKKNNIRKINSGRMYRKIEKRKLVKTKKDDSLIKNKYSGKLLKNFYESESDEYEKEDIFGNKRRKNKIIDPFRALDDDDNDDDEEYEETSKVSESKGNKEKKTKEEIKNEIKQNEEIKNIYVHPLIKLEEDIKRINMKPKKKKKIVPPPVEEPKKEEKKKNIYFVKKPKNFVFKSITNTKNENKIINTNRLKSPAINSILNDIKTLSKKVMKKKNGKKNNKNKNTIKYEKHFGYEYWKDNEFRKKVLQPLTSNKKRYSSHRSINSTIAPEDNSILSSNFSWLLKKNNEKYYNDYNDFEDNFSFNLKQDYFNPYSLHWTKSILKNAYNKKLKLKKRISGIPQIELMARSKSSFFYINSKISNNYRNFVDSKNNNFFKKNSNMFGRIYNNNEVEFPFIYKS